MRYHSPSVPALITLAGLLPNTIFSWLNASAIACLHPSVASNWRRDPRFIVGVVLYAVGFVVNRSADWTLRSLRERSDKAAE
jgi:3-oxo-5-alpha-steroid 4-dehydrogenase 1